MEIYYIFQYIYHQVKILVTSIKDYLTFFISHIIVFMRGRLECVLHSFSLNPGFIPLGFPRKVFNETDYDTKGCCTLFPSLEFFFHHVFL